MKNNLKECKISYICNNEYEYFFNKKNVVGIGLGYKITKGFCTFNKCIKVFVSKKISNESLKQKDIIPYIYKGIRTDVVESGIFSKGSLSKRVRPVTGGYSIGPCTIMGAGSMGCLVTDGKYIYILSNNHVLSDEERIPINTPILQPGVSDGGIVYRDRIGNLTKVVTIKYYTTFKHPENLVDCGIAMVCDKSLVSPKISIIGGPRGVDTVKLHQTVEKVGRTTEHTEGEVNSINATIRVEFGRGHVLFKDQILASKMSQDGDSGSLLMNLNGNAVGLIWGQSQSYSCANLISNVLKSLNIKILTV